MYKLYVKFQRVSQIHNGVFSINRDNKVNRLFHNVTNMDSDLRRFLYLDNYDSELVEIDLSNSQPLLLNVLIEDQYRSNLTMPKDLIYFRELTSTGSFYQEISKDTIYSKKDTKKIFFKEMFGRPEVNVNNEILNNFKFNFPNVKAVMDLYKKKSYKDLSIKLMRLESKIFIDDIGTELSNNGIFFIPIHDCLVVKRSDLTKTIPLIITKFRENFNLKINLTIKGLGLKDTIPSNKIIRLDGYRLEERLKFKNITILEQLNKNDYTVGYEVHKLREGKPRMLPTGKEIAGGYKHPSTSEWEKFGFTCYSLEKAVEKAFDHLANMDHDSVKENQFSG